VVEYIPNWVVEAVVIGGIEPDLSGERAVRERPVAGAVVARSPGEIGKCERLGGRPGNDANVALCRAPQERASPRERDEQAHCRTVIDLLAVDDELRRHVGIGRHVQPCSSPTLR
jgi:hypothetical protein